MRASFRTAINTFLRKFDLVLTDEEAEWERTAFAELYRSRIGHVASPGTRPVECIVFSKDRALQLHALLASSLEKVTPQVPFHVLYHASTQAHQRAYEEVRELFPRTGISFHKQASDGSFRDDLMRLLQAICSERMFFLVDDIVFTEDFDVTDFANLDTDTFVPTLRMGLNLKKCYTLQAEQPLPPLTPGPTKETMTWTWGDGRYDWSYPLSVDGHFFSTHEMTTLVRLIDFSAPNTLEDQLQKFRRFFLSRTGICYRKSRSSTYPATMYR
jgi:hypothetical protein